MSVLRKDLYDMEDEEIESFPYPPIQTETGLRQWQEEVYFDPTRFRVCCCGRRAGKTLLAYNEIMRAAQAGPDQVVWYVAPTYKMAKRIMWKLLKRNIPEENILSKNENDLEIVLKGTNSLIALKGCEDPDTLLGDSLDFLVVDEVQSINMDVLDAVLRPSMDDNDGHGLFIGTPRGMGDNSMYRLYMRGTTEGDWASFKIDTLRAGNVPPKNIVTARNVLTKTKFRQEYAASFESVQGRCFYNFDPTDSVRVDLKDTGETIHIGMDFNVAWMTACIGIKSLDEFHVIDEIVIENANTRLMCEEIQSKYPGRNIVVYPDPSGKSRKSSAEVGQTDLTIIREFGFKVVAPKKASLVVDSINDVNGLLKGGDRVRRLYISSKCRETIKCLDGLVYIQGTQGKNTVDKTMGLDHMVDALRYIISSQYSITKRVAKLIKLGSIF